MNRRIVFLVCVIFTLPLAAAVAQYLPPNGTVPFDRFLSPSFLGAGASVTSQQSPGSDSLNPAASGAKQRVTLDASYLGLVGTQTGEGWKGHIANLGITIPTRVGVVSGSGHFMTSALPEVQLGTLGELSASFAKQLYPNLLVGAGLHVLAGTGSTGTATWGLNGDLGFLSFPGTIGIMKNFRWGIAVQGIGKGFAPLANLSAFPAPFTPVAGAAFDLVDARSFQLGLSGDLGFPELQDVNLQVGATMTLFHHLSLSVTDGADLQQVLHSATLPTDSYLPSVSLSFTLSTNLGSASRFLSEHGWNRTDITTEAAAAPLPGGAWAFGTGVNAPLGVVDRTPPVISVDYPKPEYISPNNDGIKDFMLLPIRITDNRYVEGYRFDIYNDKGVLVREIENAYQTPKTRDFKTAIDQLLSVKRGIPVPASLRWGGLDNSGKLVPDGTYHFSIQAWDENGNLSKSPTYIVHVKVTPPSVQVAQLKGNALVFAPNSNSTKQTLKVDQSGSVEDLWTGEIKNSDGAVVRTFTWKNSEPKPFVWDGKTNAGQFVPNGVYDYGISATDRAGNSNSASLDNIIVDTETTPVSLAIQYSYFSPNGDGIKDLNTLTLHVPVERGIANWKLGIYNSGGTVVRSFSGTGPTPRSLVFDGRSNNGAPLPQGTYSAQLSIDYVNGNHPAAKSPPFVIDLTKPQASITENYTVFSPVGNGAKDAITFYQDTTAAVRWEGAVENAKGVTVKTFSWLDTAAARVVWDGHSSDGRLVPDGTYTYHLRGANRAGNEGRSNTVTFEINTKNTPVFISAEYRAFSPAGARNKLGLYPQIRSTQAIQSYRVDIVNSSGATVRSFNGTGSVPSSVTWEGFTDNGNPAPDGSYHGVLHVVYANGNRREASSADFLLDSKYPRIASHVNWTTFDPSPGSARPSVTINNSSSVEPLWLAEILDSSGKVVSTHYWKGTAGSFVWNGTDMQGNTVPDGTYSYQITATNVAGNTSRAVIRGIVVNTRPTPVFITPQADGFSPNGDGVDDTITFATVARQASGVQHWSVDITDQAGNTVRTFGGATTLPESITWDGKSNKGSLVPDGTYRAHFDVAYTKGTRPVAVSSPIVLDSGGPSVQVTIGPLPFSPDNNGVNDTLYFKTHISDPAKIASWKLDIFDPKNHLFKTFSGNGAPAESISWDGRSNSGELVSSAEDYPYRMEVSDAFGNQTTVHGTIPVDVLVIQEGNQLRIRIPSIIFAPNSASLDTSSPEVRASNAKILTRLAQILQKYNTYNIRVEGFAVSVYWDNPAKAKVEQQEVLIPLSLARANTVKAALVKLGVPAARMSTVGLGSENPVVPNSDLADRWKNRRVEFILIK